MGNTNIIHQIYTMMEKQNVLLSFIGDFNLAITDALLGLVDPKHSANEEIPVKKKLYKIMVECLENICRHAEYIENTNTPSIFYLSKTESYFYVVTGNYIKTADVERLKGNILALNGMNKDEVKQKYREVLSLRKLSEKGGAGVGIIDMVMKSESKLDFLFLPFDDTYTFYMLKVPVKTSSEH